MTRLKELLERLVMPGPKASHVSASETHEIVDLAEAQMGLLKEAGDTVLAATVEDDISEDRRRYRRGLYGRICEALEQKPQEPHQQRDTRPKVGVACIVMGNQERVLVGVRGPGSKRGRGKLSLPGGALEPGEEILACATRELAEETGLVLRGYSSIQFTECVLEGDTDEHWITFYVVCVVEPDRKPEVLEPTKCERWEWMTWETISKLALAGEVYAPFVKLLNRGWSPF